MLILTYSDIPRREIHIHIAVLEQQFKEIKARLDDTTISNDSKLKHILLREAHLLTDRLNTYKDQIKVIEAIRNCLISALYADVCDTESVHYLNSRLPYEDRVILTNASRG